MTEPDTTKATVTDADLGYPAWRGFISWAYSDDVMRERFTVETEISWPPAPSNGLELLIDRVTGAEKGVAGAFVVWASEMWGAEFCPPLVREAIAKHIRETKEGNG